MCGVLALAVAVAEGVVVALALVAVAVAPATLLATLAVVRHQGEGAWRVALLVAHGAVAAGVLVLVGHVLIQGAGGGVTRDVVLAVTPLLEELAKALGVGLIAGPLLTNWREGAVAGSVVGAAFAASETLLQGFLLAALGTPVQLAGLATVHVLRIVVHVGASAIAGAGVAMGGSRGAGLIAAAVVLHAAYNASVGAFPL